MLLVSYDISNDKLRTQFSKFLEHYGHRLQYSVFELRNSKRVMNNVMAEIEKKFKPRFTGTDSVVIIPITPADRKHIVRYGYAKHSESDVVIFG